MATVAQRQAEIQNLNSEIVSKVDRGYNQSQLWGAGWNLRAALTYMGGEYAALPPETAPTATLVAYVKEIIPAINDFVGKQQEDVGTITGGWSYVTTALSYLPEASK